MKDTEKDGRKKKESSGVSRAQTRKKWELARCGKQRGRRGGKTCRHNVGSTTRQLSPASFIIKRPHPRSGIYLASPACASRGDDPVDMDELRTTNYGHRRFLPRVEAEHDKPGYCNRYTRSFFFCNTTPSSLTTTACCDIVMRRSKSERYSGNEDLMHRQNDYLRRKIIRVIIFDTII